MPQDKEFDDIPTLSDIVFPGNPEKIIANKSARNDDIHPAEVKATSAAGNHTSEPPNTYIQEEIDNIVESVLAKYFFKVRKEIVDEIMQELHKKVP